jgi:hypothetical protein
MRPALRFRRGHSLHTMHACLATKYAICIVVLYLDYCFRKRYSSFCCTVDILVLQQIRAQASAIAVTHVHAEQITCEYGRL